MATQHTYTGHAYPPSRALTDTPVKSRVGTLERWRAYRAERERRVIVQWLRRTANRAHDPDPIRRRREALLHYRAAAVRTDLLEIAAALERAHDPDPAIVAALRDLLANGCGSSLYNPNIPAAELDEALQRVRAGLANAPERDRTDATATSPPDPEAKRAARSQATRPENHPPSKEPTCTVTT